MLYHQNIRLRPATVLIGFLFLLLSITGLSADTGPSSDVSRATQLASSSHLISHYSPVGADDADDTLGSFVVRAAQRDGWSFGRQVLRRTRDELGALPLRDILTDRIMQNETGGERARLRAKRFVWDLARSAVDEGVLAATDELRRRRFIETINVDLDSGVGARFAHIGVDILGALHESDDAVLAWQLRGIAGEEGRTGGNIGLIHRRAVDDKWLAGINTFLDYQKEEGDDFLRWSLGVEARSAWADIFANYYESISDDIIRRRAASTRQEAIWTASGYDVELNVHAPSQQWLTGVLGWYVWEGKVGRADVEGLRIGLKAVPTGSPLVWELTYENDDEGEQFGGRMSYRHRFGGVPGGTPFSSTFRPRDWFYAPVEREYTQRILRQEVDFGVFDGIAVFALNAAGATVALPANTRITLTRSDDRTDFLVYTPSIASQRADALSFLNSGGAVEVKKTNPADRVIVVELTYQSGGAQATLAIRSTVVLEDLSARLVEGSFALELADGTFTVSAPEATGFCTVVVSGGNDYSPAQIEMSTADRGADGVITENFILSNGEFKLITSGIDTDAAEGFSFSCGEGRSDIRLANGAPAAVVGNCLPNLIEERVKLRLTVRSALSGSGTAANPWRVTREPVNNIRRGQLILAAASASGGGDNPLGYEYSGGNTDLAVNPSTGDISFARDVTSRNEERYTTIVTVSVVGALFKERQTVVFHLPAEAAFVASVESDGADRLHLGAGTAVATVRAVGGAGGYVYSGSSTNLGINRGSGVVSFTRDVSSQTAATDYSFVVTVTDSGGAATTVTVTVSADAALVATVESDGADRLHLGAGTAVATVRAAGGAGGYVYSGSSTNLGINRGSGVVSFTRDVSAQKAATNYSFVVTVTDSGGTATTVTVTVSADAALVATVESDGANRLQLGANTAVATVRAAGGAGGYVYSGGSTNLGINRGSGVIRFIRDVSSQTAATNYSFVVTVTDSGGAATTVTVTVSADAELVATIESDGADRLHLGANTAVATVRAAGGAGGYIYSGSSTNLGINRGSGVIRFIRDVSAQTAATNYELVVTVTDGAGAATTVTATVSADAAAGAALSATVESDGADRLHLGANTAVATVRASGGAGGYVYSGSSTNLGINGRGVVRFTRDVSAQTAATNYSFVVTVTDRAGAATTVTVTVSADAALVATVESDGADRSQLGANTAVATVRAAGGAGGYIYSGSSTNLGINRGSGVIRFTRDVSAQTAATNYSFVVTVTDRAGAATTVTVTVSAEAAALAPVSDITFTDAANTRLVVSEDTSRTGAAGSAGNPYHYINRPSADPAENLGVLSVVERATRTVISGCTFTPAFTPAVFSVGGNGGVSGAPSADGSGVFSANCGTRGNITDLAFHYNVINELSATVRNRRIALRSHLIASRFILLANVVGAGGVRDGYTYTRVGGGGSALRVNSGGMLRFARDVNSETAATHYSITVRVDDNSGAPPATITVTISAVAALSATVESAGASRRNVAAGDLVATVRGIGGDNDYTYRGGNASLTVNFATEVFGDTVRSIGAIRFKANTATRTAATDYEVVVTITDGDSQSHTVTVTVSVGAALVAMVESDGADRSQLGANTAVATVRASGGAGGHMYSGGNANLGINSGDGVVRFIREVSAQKAATNYELVVTVTDRAGEATTVTVTVSADAALVATVESDGVDRWNLGANTAVATVRAVGGAGGHVYSGSSTNLGINSGSGVVYFTRDVSAQKAATNYSFVVTVTDRAGVATTVTATVSAAAAAPASDVTFTDAANTRLVVSEDTARTGAAGSAGNPYHYIHRPSADLAENLGVLSVVERATRTAISGCTFTPAFTPAVFSVGGNGGVSGKPSADGSGVFSATCGRRDNITDLAFHYNVINELSATVRNRKTALRSHLIASQFAVLARVVAGGGARDGYTITRVGDGSILWVNNSGLIRFASNANSETAATHYKITVRVDDNSGAPPATTTVTISAVAALSLAVESDGASRRHVAAGNIAATVRGVGGDGNYTYRGGNTNLTVIVAAQFVGGVLSTFGAIRFKANTANRPAATDYELLVTVTDRDSQTYIGTVTVSVPAALSATVESDGANRSQLGANTAVATVRAAGGAGGYVYSGSSTNLGINSGDGVIRFAQDVSAQTAATNYAFVVTVTDGIGDTTTVTATVSADATVSATVESDGADRLHLGVNAAVATVRAAGGSGGYVYSGSSTNLGIHRGSGVIRFTRDVSAQTAALNYELVVTVTDGAGAATTTITATVSADAALVATVESDGADRLHLGANTAVATVRASGGSGGYVYSGSSANLGINSGSGIIRFTQDVSTQPAATNYKLVVTVTDRAGAATTLTATVSADAALVATVESDGVNRLQLGANTAVATVRAVGGAGGYVYSGSSANLGINSGDGIIRFLQDVSAQKAALNYAFVVTVTDSAGAATTITATVSADAALVATVESDGADRLHLGANTAVATVRASGGSGGYVYSGASASLNINSGDGIIRFVQDVSAQTAATDYAFVVTVTDSAGAATTITATVSADAALVATVESDGADRLHLGANTAVATVRASGGAGGYVYSGASANLGINSGDGIIRFVQDVSAQTAATDYAFVVTVTDRAGVATTITATVSADAALVATVESDGVDRLHLGANTAVATVRVSGGAGGYVYSGSSANLGINSGDGIIRFLRDVSAQTAATDYAFVVTVTDSAGAATTVTVTVSAEAASMALSATVESAGANRWNLGANTAVATVRAIGGAGDYVYSGSSANLGININDGVIRFTQDVSAQTAATNYELVVTVTDGAGAAVTVTATVSADAALVATVQSDGAARSQLGANTAVATVSAIGGAGGYVHSGSSTNLGINSDDGIIRFIRDVSAQTAATDYELIVTVTDGAGVATTVTVTVSAAAVEYANVSEHIAAVFTGTGAESTPYLFTLYTHTWPRFRLLNSANLVGGSFRIEGIQHKGTKAGDIFVSRDENDTNDGRLEFVFTAACRDSAAAATECEIAPNSGTHLSIGAYIVDIGITDGAGDTARVKIHIAVKNPPFADAAVHIYDRLLGIGVIRNPYRVAPTYTSTIHILHTEAIKNPHVESRAHRPIRIERIQFRAAGATTFVDRSGDHTNDGRLEFIFTDDCRDDDPDTDCLVGRNPGTALSIGMYKLILFTTDNGGVSRYVRVYFRVVPVLTAADLIASVESDGADRFQLGANMAVATVSVFGGAGDYRYSCVGAHLRIDAGGVIRFIRDVSAQKAATDYECVVRITDGGGAVITVTATVSAAAAPADASQYSDITEHVSATLSGTGAASTPYLLTLHTQRRPTFHLLDSANLVGGSFRIEGIRHRRSEAGAVFENRDTDDTPDGRLEFIFTDSCRDLVAAATECTIIPNDRVFLALGIYIIAVAVTDGDGVTTRMQIHVSVENPVVEAPNEYLYERLPGAGRSDIPYLAAPTFGHRIQVLHSQNIKNPPVGSTAYRPIRIERIQFRAAGATRFVDRSVADSNDGRLEFVFTSDCRDSKGWSHCQIARNSGTALAVGTYVLTLYITTNEGEGRYVRAYFEIA